VPPHLKRCGLTGTCFLDAQSVDHILKNVVLGRHFDISIKIIVPFISSQIAETEIVIIAHSYPERVENQDKICLKIKKFIESKTNNLSVYVWLQLSELGHSSQ